jgi:nucleotide-binding universal stress UspA family protein
VLWTIAYQEVQVFKSIYVPMFGSERDKPALASALGLARLFDARLDCVHVRPDPVQVMASVAASMDAGAMVVSDQLLSAIAESDKGRAAQARATFDAFAREMRLEPPRAPFTLSASFREVVADATNTLVSLARYCDVSVFAPDGDASPWGQIGDTIVGAGRPVVLATTSLAGLSAPVVALAWKETGESARAVSAAMPLLAKARQVNVMSASESSGTFKPTQNSANALATLLRGHGLTVHVETMECGDRDPGSLLLEQAVALKSDLLVAGAYGHARVRQFIFGGFTQLMLRQTKLPVLLQH